MKLYGVYLSSFTVKIMLQLEAKKLAYELVFPLGGSLESEEHRGVNPMGRIPVLELTDGTRLTESGVIADYLEAEFPGTPLVSTDPAKAAQTRTLMRVADLYLMHTTTPITDELSCGNVDSPIITDAVKRVQRGLKDVNSCLEMYGHQASDELTLADCTLVPALVMVEVIFGFLKIESFTEKHPKLDCYWRDIQKCELPAKFIAKQKEAIKHKSETGDAI